MKTINSIAFFDKQESLVNSHLLEVQIGDKKRNIELELFEDEFQQEVVQFKALVSSTQKIQSKFAGCQLLPNIKGCYVQFGNLHEKSFCYSHNSTSKRAREKFQLFQIKGSTEYVISYNEVQLSNVVLIGCVKPESYDVMKEIEECATTDGKGAETITIISSE